MRVAAALVFSAMFVRADAPDAREIMRRVAENQERAQAARTAYVYDQDVFIRLQRTNGRLAREEMRKYVVAPTEKGARRKMVSVEGKIQEGKKQTTYDTAGFHTKSMDIDGSLVDSFAREIMWRKNMLGVMTFWFPLAADQQDKYTFKLEAEERYQDLDVYRISYRQSDGEDAWEGDALIERNEFSL
jgi:hypothetical protein